LTPASLPLVRLAELIDWQAFANGWSPQFFSTTRRPALPIRLMPSLLHLKHVFALSDEDTGCFQHEVP